jgi:Putative conjugal transfer nickase/helicase TraI C-term
VIASAALNTFMTATENTFVDLAQEVESFEFWLKFGLQTQYLSVNKPEALVHYYPLPVPHSDGVRMAALLVSPAVYQRYFQEKYPDKYPPNLALASVPPTAWQPLQKTFLRDHPHLCTTHLRQKQTVFRVVTRKGGSYFANVMLEPQTWSSVPLQADPHIAGIQTSAL